MKQYKRAPNCGPVPYPDDSGMLLTDEVVSDPAWEKYIPLGYVIEIDEVSDPDHGADTAATSSPTPTGLISDAILAVVQLVGPIVAGSDIIPEQDSNIAVITGDSSGHDDKINERVGTDELDHQTTGSAKPKSPTRGRPAGRRNI